MFRVGNWLRCLRGGPTDSLAALCHPSARGMHLREAPLTHEIVLAAQALPPSHPAERFLVATAEEFELTLVVVDQRMLGPGKIATLANS